MASNKKENVGNAAVVDLTGESEEVAHSPEKKARLGNDEKHDETKKIMLARRLALKEQMKQLRDEQAKELEPIEAKHKEYLKEWNNRLEEELKQVKAKYNKEVAERNHTYENQMSQLKQKRAPAIAEAKIEFETITKDLGIAICNSCANEFFPSSGESGGLCDACVDKVQCACCGGYLDSSDVSECMGCCRSSCEKCCQNFCEDCNEMLCDDCEGGFEKQRCGVSTCENCSIRHVKYCDCPKVRW